MSTTLSASVGSGGVNNRPDVWNVQTMLIKVRKRSGQTGIALDGLIGPETIGAIKSFQKEQFGWQDPDGRVDVRGRTLEHLNLLTDASGPSTFLLEPVTVKRRGKWEVRIGADGEIRVAPGDWLSKYSAVLHDNFYDLSEYMRQNGNGQFVEIADKNLIRVGESIYHIPTFLEFFRKNSLPAPVVPHPRQLTPEEKAKLTTDFAKSNFNLQGERGQAFSDAVTKLGYVDNALSLADIAGLIAEGTVIAGAATAISVASVFLGSVADVINFLNALETGARMTGMRAVCYATVAWAFGDPSPTFSPQLKRNIEAGGLNELPKHTRAWADAAASTVPALTEASLGRMKSAGEKTRNVLIEAAKGRIRLAGGENRKETCRFLMKQFEPRFSGSTLRIWQSGYDFLYPE
jgi:hypothetical protein